MTARTDTTDPSLAFVRDLIVSGSLAQPTQEDRMTLARAAVRTALEAAKAGDHAAVQVFLAEALHHLRRAEGGR